MRNPVRRAAVTFHGEPYWFDLSACTRALVRRQAEGAVTNLQDLADLAGVSRSTVSRFFHGLRGSCSVVTVTAILRALGLKFADVATPRDGADT